MNMITIEGTVHHGDGSRSCFLINPDDTSWTQWGGPVELLGNSRDYIDAMAQGLAAHSDYYRQEGVLDGDEEAPAPEDDVVDSVIVDEDPQEPVEESDLWRGPGSAYFELQQELADNYSRHAFGLYFQDASHEQQNVALQNAELLIKSAPSLLPPEERDRLNMPADC